MKIVLDVIEGVHKGQSFKFDGHSTFIVGRSNQAHFQLPQNDRYFSRLHFLVEMNPPLCRLMDLNSRNGTFVNGERVKSADLKNGDLIKGGRTIIRAMIEADITQSLKPVDEAPAVSEPAPPPVPRVAAKRSPAPTAPAACPFCGATARLTDNICAACAGNARKRKQPIPGYELVSELGHGGMGVVYLGRSCKDGNPVAVKTIVPEAAGSKSAIARFLREARILQQLQHPNIVSFRESGEANGLLFFVMDYVPGVDASDLLLEHGPLLVGRAVRLICQVLDALAYAHGAGFVHRDIKPANCLVAGSAPKEIAHLCDFGIARVYQDSRISGLTLKGDLAGTFAFMAPEQITNLRETSPAADLYSTGAMLYTLLTGQAIYDFPRQLEDQILMILQQDPVPILMRRVNLPPSLARAIDRSLQRDPNDRFPDAVAMSAALSRFADPN